MLRAADEKTSSVPDLLLKPNGDMSSSAVSMAASPTEVRGCKSHLPTQNFTLNMKASRIGRYDSKTSQFILACANKLSFKTTSLFTNSSLDPADVFLYLTSLCGFVCCSFTYFKTLMSANSKKNKSTVKIIMINQIM